MAKILIVEDDQFLRELYAETLQGEGYSVDTAEDGDMGYQKIKQGGWDLVLLDLIMPKMSGIDVAKKIQAEGTFGQFTKKIVFLTSVDKDQLIKESLPLGDGYLMKNQITPGDLINEIKLYLSSPQDVASPTGGK